MKNNSFTTPILLIIFNRPNMTRLVFENIRSIRPQKLFIAADGPREGFIGDRKKCDEARSITSNVDWDCEVQTSFREKNLGCGLGPSSAISWFFENVEEGIILEDDCIPSKSFYLFCQTLLEYYRKTPRVMHISGNNFQYGVKRGNASYYFSRFTHNQGWATWRRAWRYYDFELTPIEHRMHAWDAQWELSVKKQHGVSILPNINLVKNIGFGEDATHTKEKIRVFDLEANEIQFPLIHPKPILINYYADLYTEFNHIHNYSNPNLFWFYVFFKPIGKIVRRIIRVLKKKPKFA
jgi:hypothetical protein